jgi:hypothetical protein
MNGVPALFSALPTSVAMQHYFGSDLSADKKTGSTFSIQEVLGQPVIEGCYLQW